MNLRSGDIANMGFAEAAGVPVIIVGDIDRGGVIASLVGTHALLTLAERELVRGFLINKLRGDAALFADGVRVIEERTGWPCLGVVPWFGGAQALPAEDVLGLIHSNVTDSSPRRKPGSIAEEPERAGLFAMDSGFRRNDGEGAAIARSITIAVPQLPRIANFDDLDPLRMEPGVSVVIVKPGEALPAAADLVLIPGSKSTIADLAFVRAQGWDIDILAHHRRGGRVLGLCGGYQMLGRTIANPDGVEGPAGIVAGLGLLDVETVLGGDKATVAVSARHVGSGESLSGYEIHLGGTTGPDCARPVVDIGGRPDGAGSPDGLVMGTYVHGLFAADGLRRACLAALGAPSALRYEAAVETALDGLAHHLETHVAIDRLLAIAGYEASTTASTATATPRVAQAPR